MAQPAKVSDRHASDPVLFRGESITADGKTLRVRIVKTDFKYPLLRVEDVIIKDPQTGAESLSAQTAMVADHIIVKTKPGIAADDFHAMLTRVGATVRRRIPNSDIFVIQFPVPRLDTVPDGVAALSAEAKFVLYAEPDYIVEAQVIPDDSRFTELWGMHNTGQSGGTADADIDAPEAWDMATGSTTVRVGVIDTGIDLTHPDLAANIWINPNEIAGNSIDDDANGYVDDIRGWDFINEDNNPSDDHGHGTHCSGIIGGVGNNAQGVSGVCWQVSIVGLKFLNANGSGATSDATEATIYATGIGVNLTSNSWSGGGYSQALKDAIDAADAAGILFIAAAGNSGTDNDANPSYPSGFTSANIIAVTATDRTDAKASFSNFGATTVDLAAPGVAILSCARGGGFATLSGTSMATPHVAGACALLWSFRPELTNHNVKDILLGSVDQISSMSRKVLSDGRLNIHKALRSNLSITPHGTVVSSGFHGGVFTPASQLYTLENLGDSPVVWTAAKSQLWLDLSSTGGILAPGETTTVTVTLNAAIAALGIGNHADAVTFTDSTAGILLIRPFSLTVLDPLSVSPGAGFTSRGDAGGPFTPPMAGYVLTNNGNSPFAWSASVSQPWLEASPSGGTLSPGQETLLVVSMTEISEQLQQGTHNTSLVIANLTNGGSITRSVTLFIGPDRFTELFNTTANDTDYLTFTFTPSITAASYTVIREAVSAFPTDPVGGIQLLLADDQSTAVSIGGGASVLLFGTAHTSFHVGSNGYITFGAGDADVSESLTDHFRLPRISALFDDLDPSVGGAISWMQLADRVVVTYQNLPEWLLGGSNSFQIEMFFDGMIRITLLAVSAPDGLIGLSQGTGVPVGFYESEFSDYPTRPLLVSTLSDENDGSLGFGNGDSLREVIAAADSIPGSDVIHFTPSLNNGRIVLSGTQLTVNSDLTIDASGLSDGIAVSGGSASRVLEITAGRIVSITGLTVTGGSLNEGPGGGILNAGALFLNRVTIAGNQSFDTTWNGLGGGIANSGILHLTQSTVSGNFVFFGEGGGISNSGTLELVNSTVSHNFVDDGFGGGISNSNGIITLRHTTVSGNGVWFGTGGGVSNPTGTLTVENSIIADNTGYHFVPDEIRGEVTAFSGANFISGDPMLAPLDNYGGSTKSMPPLPGSPVIDAAVPLASTPAIDQLGDARPSGPQPDLGATEAFPFSTLPLVDSDGDLIDDRLEPAYNLTVGIDDSGVDSDGDGSSDAEELANMTDPFDAESRLKIISFTQAPGFDPGNPVFIISFTSFPGLAYSLECDQNLEFSSPQALIHPVGIINSFSVSVELGLLPGRDFVRVRRDP